MTYEKLHIVKDDDGPRWLSKEDFTGDTNVYRMIGAVMRGLKKEGATAEYLEEFRIAATAHGEAGVVQVCMEYTDPEALILFQEELEIREEIEDMQSSGDAVAQEEERT